MWILLASLLVSPALGRPTANGLGWHFVQNGTSGVLALEAMVVSPTLAIIFDRPTNDPLTINGHPAWGALWNFETNTARAIDVVSDSFCASGSFLSNGTMLSVGGQIPGVNFAYNGTTGLRFFEPCDDPTGNTCQLFEDMENLHLEVPRWYPSALRIPDGSLMIIGGMEIPSNFSNYLPQNSIEFFPPKDGGVPRYLPLLERTVPINLFPRGITLPDGRIYILANNQSIIYDIETDTEIRLPDLPNGVRNSNPYDGTIVLLPLSPPHYIPEVLACGGSASDDQVPSQTLNSQDPASDQCSRLTLTPEGIERGWEVERMLEPRIMPELVVLPNGQVVIVNGGQTGYAAFGSLNDTIDNKLSNADHPALTPSMYNPDAPLGQRISNQDMPTTDIPRMYHSTATLTPMGNIMIAGSNPNAMIVSTGKFPSELRVEYLNPPYMTVERPALLKVPKKIGFHEIFTVGVSIPDGLDTSSIKVALMDLGFSSHAFRASARLVYMDTHLSQDKTRLTIMSPPNNRVYPPGPAFIYLTVDDVTSSGVQVMVGSGASPPVPDQGIQI
ncbi:copper radical oxidase [Amanita thiersii Skay4041]|uniref:Copper radical oxidase n=1 Tax=Amanita thiersii Skay4041 TaxID=703135 RepID=A0A2A9NGN0_9AGAR|nr:copper radical oxidase [Amanita thiersii Skay4041]